MRDRWLAVLACAFLSISLGGTWVTVSKLGNMEQILSSIASNKPFPSRVDLSLKRAPIMVTATVKFVNGAHNRTLGFQAPSYEDLRKEVIATQEALAKEWESEVTVEWLGA